MAFQYRRRFYTFEYATSRVKRKPIILPVILLVACTAALSQPGEIVFNHMTRANGLASSRINSLLKDHQGYYWMSSSNGLQRFDGKRIITFQHDPRDPNSLPNNWVIQLKEDNKKRLWLNIAGNPYVYDPIHRTFNKIPVEYPGKEVFNINSFVQD